MVYILIHMIRTQIYLPQSQIRMLRAIAQKRQMSMSCVIRNLVDEGLVKKNTKGKAQKPMSTLFQVLEDIRKMGFKGPSDLAQNMDKYLYGGD